MLWDFGGFFERFPASVIMQNANELCDVRIHTYSRNTLPKGKLNFPFRSNSKWIYKIITEILILSE